MAALPTDPRVTLDALRAVGPASEWRQPKETE